MSVSFKYRVTRTSPSGTDFMADMIKAQVMHDECCPITMGELISDMTGHIVIYFSKVLRKENLVVFGHDIRFATEYEHNEPIHRSLSSHPSCRTSPETA